MSVFALAVFIAQVALGLAAFRFNGYFGLLMTFALVGGTVRSLDERGYPDFERERYGRARWLGLLATSTVVVGLIVATTAVGLVLPPWVVSQVLEVFAGSGLENIGGPGFCRGLIQAGVVAVMLGSVAGGVVLAVVVFLRMLDWVGPIETDWRRGIRPPLLLGLAGCALVVADSPLLGWIEDSHQRRRVERVVGFASAARALAVERRACIIHLERDQNRCERCQAATLTNLDLEAERASRQAAAEDQRVAELQAEGRATADARWVPPWAAIPAILTLGMVARWTARSAR